MILHGFVIMRVAFKTVILPATRQVEPLRDPEVDDLRWFYDERVSEAIRITGPCTITHTYECGRDITTTVSNQGYIYLMKEDEVHAASSTRLWDPAAEIVFGTRSACYFCFLVSCQAWQELRSKTPQTKGEPVTVIEA